MPHGLLRSCLQTLLPGIQASVFLERFWAKRPLATHGPLSRLRDVAGNQHLKSLDSLLKIVNGRDDVRAWFTQDTNGAQHFVETKLDVRQAGILYRTERVTIVVDNLGRFVPAVDRLVSGLARELGTPMKATSCNAYASPVGIGTRMHFDQQEVFLVQLRGSKKWRYALNEQVRFPTEPYIGSTIGPELALCLPDFPDRMPTAARSVVLRPGSVLYMPRGTWHESEAVDSDSLALTLTFHSASWADIVLARLRRAMIVDERWREPACAASSGPKQRRDATAYLDELLGSLPIPDAADCIRQTAEKGAPSTLLSPDVRFKRPRTVRIQIKSNRSGTGTSTLIARKPGGPTVEFEMERAFVPLCRWLLRKQGAFSVRELLKRKLLSKRDLRVLDLFVQEGLLQKFRTETRSA